jgi:hypothetical protein
VETVRVTVPVAVHRWFTKSEGWACHPELGLWAKELVHALDQYLKFTETEEEFLVPFGEGFLLGRKFPDEKCSNPKQANGKPFVLQCAYLEGPPPNEERIKTVRDLLAKLPLPEAEGKTKSLRVQLDIKPATPRRSANHRQSPVEPTPRESEEVQSLRERQHELKREVRGLKAEVEQLETILNRTVAARTNVQKELSQTNEELTQALDLLKKRYYRSPITLFGVSATLLLVCWLGHSWIIVPLLVLLVIGSASVGFYQTIGITLIQWCSKLWSYWPRKE